MSAANQPPRPPRPREQLPITLFEGVVLAVRADNGLIYVGLRDLCASLGLNHSAQRRRILLDEALHLTQFRVQSGSQFRTLDFLLLEDIPVWLLGVQAGRVSEQAQERFGYVKMYLVSAVQRAFAELSGLPDAPSSAIEDLADLDRIDQAFAQLAEIGRRQEELEASQDRARSAFRDLRALLTEVRDRVQELERRINATLSPTQRGTIYQMVQQWGMARAERDRTLSPGVAIRRSWAEVNAAFGASTYTDLPAARYDEIVRYVKDHYRALTGHELDAVEQAGLEGIDDA
ncbi:phage antirepressor N-terminal domain-containing protein [Chloroflexus sp.]|uniref:phage antirepressor N-terminal domain-containing protein n=1 Tax=Chloroflexus sp. TaxID=1904827 RepID=UPI002ACEA46D|nr:phage antirepressor N-terminal domain-containing protein [Chloroflexus sp.]